MRYAMEDSNWALGWQLGSAKKGQDSLLDRARQRARQAGAARLWRGSGRHSARRGRRDWRQGRAWQSLSRDRLLYWRLCTASPTREWCLTLGMRCMVSTWPLLHFKIFFYQLTFYMQRITQSKNTAAYLCLSTFAFDNFFLRIHSSAFDKSVLYFLSKLFYINLFYRILLQGHT